MSPLIGDSYRRVVSHYDIHSQRRYLKNFFCLALLVEGGKNAVSGQLSVLVPTVLRDRLGRRCGRQ